MASRSTLLKLTFVVAMVLAVVVLPPPADAAISCSQVLGYLRPCIGYVTGSVPGKVPPAVCCTGIKSLNSAAKVTPDRQAVCRCLKQLANGFGSGPVNRAGAVPGKCGVNIPFKISLSTDCSKVR
ncbi:hypothetical protein Nepgr_011861 [Nepenthes gracilis]|uniref:Non-specific lipid-transfer protein n=1 Tax=Nepenthes gracilis TaxID=150966 RepID=A0AAD3XMS1_NEPGR|nr:hypothetical protein Nepgr_011861 [Nepenthes gracilis]